MTKRSSVLLAILLAGACSSTTSNGDGGTNTNTDGGVTTDGGSSDGGTDGGTSDGGSAVTGSATVTGQVNNVSVTARDATTTVNPIDAFQRLVVITATENACADLQSGTLHKDTTGVTITLRNLDQSSNSQALTTGTYNISSSTSDTGLTATVALISSDGSCAIQPLATADSGTVTISTADLTGTGGLTGTFTANFATDTDGGTDTLTGTFDAPNCDVTSAPTQTTCQ